MSARGSLAVLAIVAWAGTSVGCSSTSTCSRDEDTLDFYDGYVTPDRTLYSSVKPAGTAADGGQLSNTELEALPPYTHFPANRSIVFHIGLNGLHAFDTDTPGPEHEVVGLHEDTLERGELYEGFEDWYLACIREEYESLLDLE